MLMVSEEHWKTSNSEWLRQRGHAKLHMFVGDGFVTLTRDAEMRKLWLRLNGVADVRAIVEDEEKLKQTDQYKTMTLLGFWKADSLGMVYAKELGHTFITVRFYNSRIKEILVNNESVKSYSMEIEYHDAAE